MNKIKKFVEEFSILSIIIIALSLSAIFAIAQSLEFSPAGESKSSPQPVEPVVISVPDDGEEDSGGNGISNSPNDNSGSNSSGGSGGSGSSRTSSRFSQNNDDSSAESDRNLTPEQKTEKSVLKRVVSILEELKLIVKKLNKLILNQQ